MTEFLLLVLITLSACVACFYVDWFFKRPRKPKHYRLRAETGRFFQDANPAWREWMRKQIR